MNPDSEPEGTGINFPRLGPRGVEPHLVAALSAAVPLWIADMRCLTASQRQTVARNVAQVVAEKGDILMFGGKRGGETAEVFNALARGMAALAYQPGGVTFAGLHFEAAA